MQQYLIKKDHIFIEFDKPLYWDRIFIREKYINHAIKYKIPIKVKLGKVTYVVKDVKKWKKTGEKMSKVFKRPDCPMILWGNFLKNLGVEENLQGVIDGVISASSALMKMAEADPARWEALRKILHKRR